MTATDAFNLFEAILWPAIGFALFIVKRREATWQTAKYSLLTWLVLFGISDAIKFFTGAWWRPLWLAAFKGLCLLGIAFAAIRVWRRTRQAKATGSP